MIVQGRGPGVQSTPGNLDLRRYFELKCRRRGASTLPRAAVIARPSGCAEFRVEACKEADPEQERRIDDRNDAVCRGREPCGAKALMASIQKANPGKFSTIASSTRDEKIYVIRSYGDIESASFMVLDTATHMALSLGPA